MQFSNERSTFFQKVGFPLKAIIISMKLSTLYYIKKTIFTLFIAAILIAFGASITAMAALDKYTSLESTISSVSVGKDNSASIEAEEKYVVKAYEGIIGIFDGENDLLYTVDVYIKTLPAKDRALLEKGIYADSHEELLEILGDYTA